LAARLASSSMPVKVISDCAEFIIGTEIGVFYELKRQNPEKQFYTLTDRQICWDMKKVTLERVAEVLQNETNEVQISEMVRQQAMRPLERMLELSK